MAGPRPGYADAGEEWESPEFGEGRRQGETEGKEKTRREEKGEAGVWLSFPSTQVSRA